MLGPGFVPISEQLGITVVTLSEATAWLILTLGLCVFIMNPIAKIYGKRPVYVFASVILFIVSIWGGVADTYGSFLGSELIHPRCIAWTWTEIILQAESSAL